ncbi:hypothetical protein JB92DRAFT_671243 [Gautieria morchelliformis]|nr:hypothetical protein JB92DRAFT_671243 [Gautieria morchelliformis]
MTHGASVKDTMCHPSVPYGTRHPLSHSPSHLSAHQINPRVKFPSRPHHSASGERGALSILAPTRKMHISTILSVAGSFAVANAHFLLNYPQTRGFVEAQEVNFCGGFPLSPNRTQFPINNGIVSITSEHPKANVDILISFDSNPTTFQQFNTTSSGQSIPFLLPFTQMNAQGDACFPVNISSLGLPEVQNGANATIMVQFNGGDGDLFQCSDVVLSNTFTVPSDAKCDNATGAFPTSSGSSGTSTSPPVILFSTLGIMALVLVSFGI